MGAKVLFAVGLSENLPARSLFAENRSESQGRGL